jgi:excisionase family DNA binding protein
VRPRSVLIDEAAEILGVSRRTVYYRIREGTLETVRTRGVTQRVLVESIEALLREKMARVKKKERRPKEAVSAAAPVAPAAADPARGGIADVSSTDLFARSRVLWQQR